MTFPISVDLPSVSPSVCAQSLRAENEQLKQHLAAQQRVLRALGRRAEHSLAVFASQLEWLDPLWPERWTQPLATFSGEVERLSSLVRDALLLQRLEAGQVPLQPQPLPTLALLERMAQLPGPRLLREFGPPLPLLLADLEQTEAVLVELLGRAQRYSDPASPVVLGAAASGGELNLWVAAQCFGPLGTSEDFAPEIALCCRRIEVQSGRLTCSRRPDGLSAVSLWLPAA